MFSKELESLIQATLEDGILEDYEKEALVKRAQKEGVDLAELEIYINAQLQKRKRELNQKKKEASAIQAKEELEYEKERAKELRQCPKCGEFIPQLSTVCPACGHIIEKNKTDDKMVFLVQLLKKIISGEIKPKDNHIKDIPKDDYDRNKQYYDILMGGKMTKSGNVYCRFNYQAILSEASLYKDNPEIKDLLDQIEESIKKENSTSTKILRFLKRNLWWMIVVLIVIGFYVKCEMNSPERITSNVIELINEDKLSEAKDVVMGIEFEHGLHQIQDYDAMFLAVIKEYINRGDFDTAEIVALAYRSKLEFSFDWDDAPTYKYLKSLYKKEGRDFSSLQYDE